MGGCMSCTSRKHQKSKAMGPANPVSCVNRPQNGWDWQREVIPPPYRLQGQGNLQTYDSNLRREIEQCLTWVPHTSEVDSLPGQLVTENPQSAAAELPGSASECVVSSRKGSEDSNMEEHEYGPVADQLAFKMANCGNLAMTPEQLQAVYGMAYKLYEEHHLHTAKRLFVGLCTQDSSNVRYWRGAGAVAQELGDLKEAISFYTQALDVRPTDIVSLCYRGECFMQLGCRIDAIHDFEAAVSLGKQFGNESYRSWVQRAEKHRTKINEAMQRRQSL
eukprot:GILK01012728.1.p1 GENE.GILK01012728.1~~GILK01012728.1.p1  ORF type:complete len:276 (-),score=24.28 GILK01012728.1:126-953(-)